MSGVIALLDAYGPNACKFKTKGICRVCTVPLRVIMLILAVLLWILAAVLLGLTTGISDFCIEADANIYDLVSKGADATTDQYMTFFVRQG